MGMGLGRVQQRFNAAVAALKALVGRKGTFSEGQAEDRAVASGKGQPLAAKYLRSSNPAEVRSKYAPHQGERERAIRRERVRQERAKEKTTEIRLSPRDQEQFAAALLQARQEGSNENT